MNKIWMMLFLLSSVFFIHFLVSSNSTRMKKIRGGNIPVDRSVYDVPFDDRPSVVFKPLFMDRNIR